MEVRHATPDELDTVADVARWSCTVALGEMVPSPVVDAEVRERFRRSILAEHILNRHLVVGADDAGHFEVIVLIDDLPGHTRLTTVVVPTHPSRPPDGAAMVTGLRAMGWTGPLVSDAALGHTDQEDFHESAGFSPGEIVVDHVGGHDVFRRTWWLGPALSAAG